MTYLALAYAVFWLITFAFVFWISASQRRLHRELDDLHRALLKRDK